MRFANRRPESPSRVSTAGFSNTRVAAEAEEVPPSDPGMTTNALGATEDSEGVGEPSVAADGQRSENGTSLRRTHSDPDEELTHDIRISDPDDAARSHAMRLGAICDESGLRRCASDREIGDTQDDDLSATRHQELLSLVPVPSLGSDILGGSVTATFPDNPHCAVLNDVVSGTPSDVPSSFKAVPAAANVPFSLPQHDV